VLYYKSIGEGKPLVILHGLFGMSDNWRTFSGLLKDQYNVILVDLRNHGRSFWSDDFNYDLLSNDIIELIDFLELQKVSILGHSMGGKVAINMARHYPERVDNLMVIDIGFKKYPPGHTTIFDAVLSIDPAQVNSRNEADEQLAKYISEMAIRQFLMKSLTRSKGGDPNEKFRWKTNFPSLLENYSNILTDIKIDKIETRSLFVRGTKSHYIREEDYESLNNRFDNLSIAEIESGHWVHAERPKELFTIITSFLNGSTS